MTLPRPVDLKDLLEDSDSLINRLSLSTIIYEIYPLCLIIWTFGNYWSCPLEITLGRQTDRKTTNLYIPVQLFSSPKLLAGSPFVVVH